MLFEQRSKNLNINIHKLYPTSSGKQEVQVVLSCSKGSTINQALYVPVLN
uniref:Uncharacterized protein n=1 Tax=Arundo donax TaxID=35708 RepID=A0A0A8Z868_ARUDO